MNQPRPAKGQRQIAKQAVKALSDTTAMEAIERGSKENVMDKKDMPVKDGGLNITDFEDLRIAFIDMQEQHNALSADYRAFRRDADPVIRENVRYGL